MINKYFNNVQIAIKRNKLLIKNFSFISILQLFNFVLPLITYPYLIRVLGKENYGLIVYVQSIIAFLVIIVGFGFNISATKDVSLNRNNLIKLNEIVSSVIIIKLFLFSSILLILSIVLFIIPFDLEDSYKKLFLLTLWMCIYEILLPIWYFQGIEKMKYITYITLISRFTFLGLIFILIKSPSDYLLVPIINGFGAILAGIASLFIIFKKHKVKFYFPRFKKIKYYFQESLPFFFSNILVILKERSNVLIIGSLFSLGEVAYYDLAQKIIEIIRLPFIILKDTIFPSLAKEKEQLKLKKFFKLSFILSIIANIILLIFSPYIVFQLGGENMLFASNLTRLFSFIIPLSVVSMFMGTSLIIFGSNKVYRNSIIISTISYIFVLILLYLLNYINSHTLILSSLLSLTAEILYRNFQLKKIKLNESTF